MNPFTRIFTGFLFLAALACPAAAQTILPSSFAGWTASAPSTMTPVAGIDQILGGDAAAFREYVVRSVEQRPYTQGNQTSSLTIYRMRDPSSAYGAFTFLRNDLLSGMNLGAFAGASRDRALIVVGDLLLDVTGTPARPSNAELKQLADTLDKVADHTPYPSIGGHLPEKDLIADSTRYVIGPLSLAKFVPIGTDDWMGFDYSAETIVARYRNSGKELSLIITSYPTQQIAADKFAGMLRRFVFDPPGDVPANQNVLFGKRVSSIVAIVAGAPSKEVAAKLLDQVGYESQVTWNEPKQTFTEPTITSMILGAFMGTGAIMLLAVAAGIGFGGLRVLLKIFFPNKIFDRENQIEILQLGITSKPIKAKDFY